MNNASLLVCSGITLLCSACDARSPDHRATIAANALHDRMQREDIFLVDVHIPEQRHIRGTDLFVPYNEIDRFLDRFPADKSSAIYLYCRSGRMAVSAARSLRAKGYRNLIQLEGGAEAWRAAGFSFD